MTSLARARAFAVHIFTACGAALALLALIFATGEHWTAMFFCLGLALIVDGIDGPMARSLDVEKVLPRWHGATLDLIVDFVTYVFVPAFAIAASGVLPDALAIPAGVAIAVSGALYFADGEMKTRDNYFKGFPALWNLVAFYLYVLTPQEWVAAAIVAALVVLTFAPVRFVHPVRVRRFRAVTIAVMVIWALLALVTLVENLQPDLYVKVALTAIAVYFFAVSFLDRVRQKP